MISTAVFRSVQRVPVSMQQSAERQPQSAAGAAAAEVVGAASAAHEGSSGGCSAIRSVGGETKTGDRAGKCRA